MSRTLHGVVFQFLIYRAPSVPDGPGLHLLVPPRFHDFGRTNPILISTDVVELLSRCATSWPAHVHPTDADNSFSRAALTAVTVAGGVFASLRSAIHCDHLYASECIVGQVMAKTRRKSSRRLRSQLWFDNPENPGMTALYLERYLNFGLTPAELRSGKPIIGIAQTGSDLSPCNRHHLDLAKRVREGIRTAGGVALEFPCHPIQETGKRPTAALDRKLAYLSLVEVLYGYPLDGVVLMTGCDKTTPACLMAAATVNIPAIVLSGGPMLNGWWKGERAGSGTVVWKAREELAAGRIDNQEFLEIAAASAPSIGHCNTMGTASTMNAL